MNIDIVYLWVNGNDPVWRAKKDAFLGKEKNQLDEQAINEARFTNNDELKYSLRSIEKNAPWIRNIYIVTDNQVPEWLDTTNPRIKIINHTEIIPREALPTFSSTSIEWCIDKIPGLSEHFLLANDDTFIGIETTPDFFFTFDGRPFVRLKNYPKNKNNPDQYLKMVSRSQNLIYNLFGKFIKYIPHHNIDAYRKSDFKKCKELFSEQISQTINRHFRCDDDLHRSVVQYYTIATGNGVLRRMNRYNRTKSLFDKIKRFLQDRFCYDSRLIHITTPDIERIIRKYNPTLFCLNDGEFADNECRKRAHTFLENKFPIKSSFEF